MELLLGGVEGEVAHVERRGRAEPLVELLLGALEASVAVSGELGVEELSGSSVFFFFSFETSGSNER